MPAAKFSVAAWKDICDQIGRSSSASERTSPAKNAALAMVSTTVGPAGQHPVLDPQVRRARR